MPFLPHVMFLVLAGQIAAAQATPAAGVTLTLDDAIGLGRQNSPALLQTQNGRRSADAAVKAARGALLPSSSASFNSQFLQGGAQIFDGTSIGSTSNSMYSSYDVGLGYSISAGSILGPGYASLNRDATDADIRNATQQLRAQITQAYITVLEDQARSALQDTLRTTALAQLDLTRAKLTTGAGTALDVSSAEVGVGQADITVLTARNTVQLDLLQLYQLMGVALPEGEIHLTTTFLLAEPTFTRDSLIQLATRVNPGLQGQRIRETSSSAEVRIARAGYLPSLSLGTGLAGNAFQYTDSSRRLFPSTFTKSPLSISGGISVPVFNQFSNQTRVEQAQIDQQNQEYALRGQELALTTAVTQAYLTLITAYRTIQLQAQVAAQARNTLSFAEQRYQLGAAPFIDVTTAQGTFSQAEINRVSSVYDFQKAFAVLEGAVGQPLR